MAPLSEQDTTSSSSRAFRVGIREVPAGLREVPAQLREVPALPFRAGRHLTAWMIWQTSRITVLIDHSESQPPKQ